MPREEQIEDEDRIPDDLRARAAEVGLFGYAKPEEYGGPGVTMSEDVALAAEFGCTTPHSARCSAPATRRRSCSAPRWWAAPSTKRCRGTGAWITSDDSGRALLPRRPAVPLHEGTSEVQRLIIGGALLREAGMPRG